MITTQFPPSRERSRLLHLIAVVAVSFGCATAAYAQSQPRDIAPAIRHDRDLVRAEFAPDRAYDIVGFVEKYFRVPGNSGFNASLDRVEQELRSAGYVRESEAAPGQRLVFRIEERPLRSTWEPHDASLTIEGADKPLLRFSTNRNMVAINSFSTPDTGVVTELVYVKESAPDAFESADVRGKVVLVQGRASRAFQQAVVQHGAAGVLAYSMPEYTQPQKYTTSIQFTSIPLDTIRRAWAMPISYGAFHSLQAALASGPVRVRAMVQATSTYPAVERTIVAEVRGDTRPDERFVFSAHVQEPGANDNATGVGTLTEDARVLATLVERGDISPRRTITMIFGNEIAQTRNFLADDSVRTRGVLWGMSLDMVGEDTRKTGGTFLIEKMPDPSAVWTRGADHHTEWGGSVYPLEKLTPHYFNDVVLGRCLDQAEGTGWVVRTNPYEGGSDHSPYIAFGKPGVLLWHFTDVFYHTDNDRLDKVSPTELENSGVCALSTALTLTAGDSVTTRALVAEQERAALARLSAELELSRRAMMGGGDPEHERLILRTWTDWYAAAIRRMSEIELPSTSPGTAAAIAAAADNVERAGARSIAALGR